MIMVENNKEEKNYFYLRPSIQCRKLFTAYSASEILNENIKKMAFLDDDSLLVQYKTPELDLQGRIMSKASNLAKFGTVVFKPNGQIMPLTEKS